MRKDISSIEFKNGDLTLTLYQTKESRDVCRYPGGDVIAVETLPWWLSWTLYKGNSCIAEGVADTIMDTEALGVIMDNQEGEG